MIISYLCSMKIHSNSVGELRRHYAKILGEIYDSSEANTLIMILLEDFFGINRIKLALNPDICLSGSDFEKLDSAVSELLKNKPVQYVTGQTEFCGFRFEVNENVLIPRAETEELVYMIRDFAAGRMKAGSDTINILDIGTGSGCIATSLAKLISNSNVTAIDISKNALDVARRNASLNHADIDFIHADIFSNPLIPKGFDIIVSNPPYVCASEKRQMRANVLDFEPHTALFVSDSDPLVFYKQIALFAKEKLNPRGVLWFEINERFGNETSQACEQCGLNNVTVFKDFLEKDRFVRASR